MKFSNGRLLERADGNAPVAGDFAGRNAAGAAPGKHKRKRNAAGVRRRKRSGDPLHLRAPSDGRWDSVPQFTEAGRRPVCRARRLRTDRFRRRRRKPRSTASARFLRTGDRASHVFGHSDHDPLDSGRGLDSRSGASGWTQNRFRSRHSGGQS